MSQSQKPKSFKKFKVIKFLELWCLTRDVQKVIKSLKGGATRDV